MKYLNKIKLNFKKSQILQFTAIVIVAILLAAFSSFLTPVMIISLVLAAGVFVFILEKPIWGIFLLAFLLPFERIGAYDIAGITVRPSQIIFLLALISWIVFNLLRKKFDIVKNPIFWPMIIFIGINTAGLIYAPNLERSVLTLIFTSFTMLIALIVPNMIKSKERLKKLIWFLILGYIVVTAFGIFQFMGDIAGLPTSITGLRDHYTKDVLGFPRVQSTALEPLYFANYLLLPIAILYALFLSKKSSIKSFHLIGLLALGVVNLILTVSRGGYIAAAIMIFLISLFMFKKIFKPKNILIILLVLIIVSSLAFRFFNLEDSFEKFKEHTFAIFSGASYFERVYTFEQATSMWYQHPLIGWGPGSFGPYVSAHPYVIPADGWNIVNNEPLELLAETGILGLLSMVVLFAILIYRTIKAIIVTKDTYYKAILIALLATIFAIVVQYQTFSVLYVTHIWFLVGLTVAVQNLVLLNEKNVE